MNEPEGGRSLFDEQLRVALPWISLVLGLVFGSNGIILSFVITPETAGMASLHPALPAVLSTSGMALLGVSFLLSRGLRVVGSWALIASLMAMTFAIGLVAAPGPTETLIALTLAATILLSVTFERAGAIRLVTAAAIVHWCLVLVARVSQGLIVNADMTAIVQFLLGPPVLFALVGAFVNLALRAVRSALTQRDSANDALRVARDRAYSATRAKSAFFANMSHELRTPLNAIIGYSEFLLEEPPDDAESVADIQRINVAANHLLALVNDVLDMSAMDAGRMELSFERTSVSDLLDETVATIQPAVKRHGNVLHTGFGALEEAWVDPLRLRQIVLNLLSNAAKFTRNGTIRLLARTVDEGIEIDVEDTGFGIEEDRLVSIFEPFERDEALAQRNQEPSTGLGLAIVRELVEMMEGRVAVQSRIGEGSRFTVWIPLKSTEVRRKLEDLTLA